MAASGPVRIERLFSVGQIRQRVSELAARLCRDYAHSPLTVVCIAEGARPFVDDLLVELGARGLAPERLDVRASRSRGTVLGPVQVERFDPDGLAGRDVLVVDDIADRGDTLRAVVDLVALGEPRSVRTAVLVDKGAASREPLTLDYVGFRVESGWVVGYGMDLDGAHRELEWIGQIVDDRF